MKRSATDLARLAACGIVACLAQSTLAQTCWLTATPSDPSFIDTGWEYVLDDDFDGSPDPSPTSGCNNTTGGPRWMGDKTLAIGSHTFVGQVGVYDGPDGGTYRDLDWIKFNLDQPGYINIDLSMSKDGVPFDSTYDPPQQSILFIAYGQTEEMTDICDTAAFVYGEALFEACPQVVSFFLPNGNEDFAFPMPAGEHLLVVTTPSWADQYRPEPGGHGIDWVMNVTVTGLENPSCGTAWESCVTVNADPGCSDMKCCETVCGYRPSCCSSSWDQSCVDDGVTRCGNFIYACEVIAGAPENDCAYNAMSLDPTIFPLNVPFDGLNATTDGPNDVGTLTGLCSSSTVKDMWFNVGPLAYSGELSANMCDLGNTGDAVLSMFDLGVDEFGNPIQSLTEENGYLLRTMYTACRDDVCDDNADNEVDLGGPAGMTLIGVTEGHYYLVRIGTFLDRGQDPADPAVLGLVGSVNFTFRSIMYSNGAQEAMAKSDGTFVNLGWISGYSSAANPKRWIMVPFTTEAEASVNGLDFAAFSSDTDMADQYEFKVLSRDSMASDHGLFGRPFGDGEFNEAAVLASGVGPWSSADFADIGDRYNQRFFVDLPAGTEFALPPGDYYMSIYGSSSTGANEYLAWLSYARGGFSQILTTLDNTGTNPIGPTLVGNAFGWRGVGSTPSFIAYQIYDADGVTPTYMPRSDLGPTPDDPGLTFQATFSIKGALASSCFGDIDGSGSVDSGDVALALLDFGPCPGCSADLDQTGEVDFGDIALVLLSAGPCF